MLQTIFPKIFPIPDKCSSTISISQLSCKPSPRACCSLNPMTLLPLGPCCPGPSPGRSPPPPPPPDDEHSSPGVHCMLSLSLSQSVSQSVYQFICLSVSLSSLSLSLSTETLTPLTPLTPWSCCCCCCWSWGQHGWSCCLLLRDLGGSCWGLVVVVVGVGVLSP